MKIYRHGNRWRLKMHDDAGVRRWMSFDTEDEAIAYVEHLAQGVQRIDDVWSRLERKTITTPYHEVELPEEPYGLVFLSDLHFGSPHTDYRQARLDAEVIRDTPGMYAVFHGDGIDNWIIPKMAGLQRGQAVDFDDEWALLRRWLSILGDKLIIVVAGNHDNWTYTLGGIDFLQNLVDPAIFYDPQQILFTVSSGEHQLRVCVRHKWRGQSILNPTHGMERAARDIDADVYVGGHTHIATLARQFSVRERDRLALLTGTYKRYDTYARQLGLPPSQHSGAGALVIDPRKGHTFIRDIREAADYLTWKRRTERGDDDHAQAGHRQGRIRKGTRRQ